MLNNCLFIQEGQKRNAISEALYQEKQIFFKKGVLRLVGIYTMNNGDIVYSFPKYMDIDFDNVSESELEQLKTITKVIEKVRPDDDLQIYEFDANYYKLKKKQINSISLAQAIINDYCQDGIYTENQTLTGKFNKGKTLWGNTIKKNIPFISDDTPVYDKVNRRAVFEKSYSLYTELHKNIVLQCYDVIKKLYPLRNIRMPECNVNLGADLSKYESNLLSKLSGVFIQREIELFKMLAAWCAQSSRNYRHIGCTTDFELVWESVNDTVLGNTEKRLNESAQPVYHLKSGDYTGIGEAKPDTIRAISTDTDKHLVIFDSKYYIPRSINESKKEIRGYPANSDIVKQLAYLREIRRYAELHKREDAVIHYHNAFLLPQYLKHDAFSAENKLLNNIGYVNCGEFYNANNILEAWHIAKPTSSNEATVKSTDEDQIDIIIVDPDKLYALYLSGKKASDADILNVIRRQ